MRIGFALTDGAHTRRAVDPATEAPFARAAGA